MIFIAKNLKESFTECKKGYTGMKIIVNNKDVTCCQYCETTDNKPICQIAKWSYNKNILCESYENCFYKKYIDEKEIKESWIDLYRLEKEETKQIQFFINSLNEFQNDKKIDYMSSVAEQVKYVINKLRGKNANR